MKSGKHYNWLQVVEGCSVVSCIAGTIASIVYQKLIYASAPLAVALSLNLINKSKFQQQMRQYNSSTVTEMHQAINSLHREVQTLDLDPIRKSLLQLQQRTETLTQQFNTRPETQEVEELKTAIAQLITSLDILSQRFEYLSTAKEIETNETKHEIVNLNSQLNTLIQQVNSKPEAQEIDQALNKLKNGTEAQVKTLKAQLQAFNVNQINSNIAQLQSQVDHISQQQEKALLFDSNYLEERLTESERKNLAIYKESTARFISAIKQLQVDKAVTETAIAKMTEDIDILTKRLDNLPVPPAPVDLSSIEETITRLSNQLSALAQKFLDRSEPAAIERLAQIVNHSQERINNLLLPLESIDLSELKKVVASVHERLISLESLNLASIPEQFTQQQIDLQSAWKQLEHLRLSQSSVAELTSAQVEGLKQEIEKLRFHMVKNLIPKIEHFSQQQQALEHLLNQQKQHLDNLDISVNKANHDNQSLKQDIFHYNSDLNKTNTLLNKHNQNIIQINNQLETLQQFINGFNARFHSSQSLDDIQQHLKKLQQLMTEYVKTEYLDNVLLSLCEEFAKQIDTVVDIRIAEINQLLTELQPTYRYELVIDRSGSRDIFMEALDTTKHRLIIVSPWLNKNSINSVVLSKFRALLDRQGRISLGWGCLTDAGKHFNPTSPITRQQFLQFVAQNSKNAEWKYDALPDLQKLEQEYRERFQLKLLGTNEKFLVCIDAEQPVTRHRSFALIGSHNLLTSSIGSRERELGLRTNDPRIIEDLIQRFDSAPNLEENVEH